MRKPCAECIDCNELWDPDYEYVIGGYVVIDGDVLCRECWDYRADVRALMAKAAAAEAEAQP